MKTIILLAILISMPQRIIGFSINGSHNPVVQQPINQVSLVSENPIAITQVWSDRIHGRILVAHNYLAGQMFLNMKYGDIVTITLPDMTTEKYQVVAFKEVDLNTTTMRNNPNYNNPDVLVMQTCWDDKSAVLVTAYKVD